MNCQSYQELLIDHVAGELTEEDRVRLEQHLAECVECGAEIDRLRTMTRAALPTVGLDVGSGIEGRLLAEMERRRAVRSAEPIDPGATGTGLRAWFRTLIARPSRAFAGLAVVVCAIAFGFVLGQLRGSTWEEAGLSPGVQPVREPTEASESEAGRGLADLHGSPDDSLALAGGGAWAGRGWIRFASTPTDAISIAESFPTDTL